MERIGISTENKTRRNRRRRNTRRPYRPLSKRDYYEGYDSYSDSDSDSASDYDSASEDQNWRYRGNIGRDRSLWNQQGPGYGPLYGPLRGGTWESMGLHPQRGAFLPYHAGWWRPRADILDADDTLRVEFELPGVSIQNIGLVMGIDHVILHSVKMASRKEDQGLYFQSERHFGNFYRRLDLPEYIDISGTTAVLDNGVLKVTCPKMGGIETKGLRGARKIDIVGDTLAQRMTGNATSGRQDTPIHVDDVTPRTSTAT